MFLDKSHGVGQFFLAFCVLSWGKPCKSFGLEKLSNSSSLIFKPVSFQTWVCLTISCLENRRVSRTQEHPLSVHQRRRGWNFQDKHQETSHHWYLQPEILTTRTTGTTGTTAPGNFLHSIRRVGDGQPSQPGGVGDPKLTWPLGTDQAENGGPGTQSSLDARSKKWAQPQKVLVFETMNHWPFEFSEHQKAQQKSQLAFAFDLCRGHWIDWSWASKASQKALRLRTWRHLLRDQQLLHQVQDGLAGFGPNSSRREHGSQNPMMNVMLFFLPLFFAGSLRFLRQNPSFDGWNPGSMSFVTNFLGSDVTRSFCDARAPGLVDSWVIGQLENTAWKKVGCDMLLLYQKLIKASNLALHPTTIYQFLQPLLMEVEIGPSSWKALPCGWRGCPWPGNWPPYAQKSCKHWGGALRATASRCPWRNSVPRPSPRRRVKHMEPPRTRWKGLPRMIIFRGNQLNYDEWLFKPPISGQYPDECLLDSSCNGKVGSKPTINMRIQPKKMWFEQQQLRIRPASRKIQVTPKF